jgi:hypothetical protein
MVNWKTIENILPQQNYPVFLSREPVQDLSGTDLGHLILSEEGFAGWYNGDVERILALESRKYWVFVEEYELSVPHTMNEKELKVVLERFFGKLRQFDMKFRKLATWMIKSGAGVHYFDYYISGILSRGLSLIYGFETLMRSSNFISASHLVRPHLDNYLRLYAAWIVDDPHEFTRKIWSGEAVRKLKDRDGQKMTDMYLKDKAKRDHPWIEDVYNETSAFIHFSHKHIKNATTLKSMEDRTLSTFVGKTDNNVSDESRLEAVICMIKICNCISELVFGYIDTKRIRG